MEAPASDPEVPGRSVLITGAAGFIGSHLAERCLGLGWRVTGVDALTDYYAPWLKRANLAEASQHPWFSFVEGDLLELELAPLLDGISLVFHLAAQPGVRASWDRFGDTSRFNIDATQRLLAAARGRALDRVVIASSSSIYGDPKAFPTPEEVRPSPVSPYGVSKLATEHLADVYRRNHDVPSLCLRYFTVFGPRQRPDMALNRVIGAALTAEPFTVYGDGEQTRDFTFVHDAVSGTIAAAQCGEIGASYNIGGGTRRSMNQVLDEVEELTDRAIERHHVPAQAGDARDTEADIARARRELGFDPTFDFRTGLDAQVQWQSSLLPSRT